MLAAIAGKVSQENLSVENITTELRTGKNGRRDFVIECDCTSPDILSTKELNLLVDDFTGLKNAMKFDVVDVRVHLDP